MSRDSAVRHAQREIGHEVIEFVTAKTKDLRRETDRDVPNRVRYIRVYAKRDGRWRAVAQMAAPLASDETPKT